MSIHDKPICGSNGKIHTGTCKMPGCNNTWESPTVYRKYCGTAECNKAVQNMNNEKHRKRNKGLLPKKTEKQLADNIREQIERDRKNQSFLCTPLRKIRELF